MRLRSGTSFMEPPAPALELPGPLLQAVLQLLETRDVLSAARACSQLRAAAAAALDRIALYVHSTARPDSLLLYLEHHGRRVSSLHVYMADVLHLTGLPACCGRLQALSLTGGSVQLGASNGQPGVLQAASALTSLCMNFGSLTDSAQDAAAAVARLTRLQRLELDRCRFAGGGVLPGSMLAPLTALTAMQLCEMDGKLQAATLEHLSGLRGLQELELSGYTLGPALTALQHLQQLTALELRSVHSPHLSGLSSCLQRLELRNCRNLDPQVLAVCTQLRHLHLLMCDPAGGPEEATAALLAHLQQCTQLTHLRISGSRRAYQLADTCAGLTASNLRRAAASAAAKPC